MEVPQKKDNLTRYKANTHYFTFGQNVSPNTEWRGKNALFYSFPLVCFGASAVQPCNFLQGASVLWHFGVILRVNVPAQADGQDHPQQLSNKPHKV